AVQSARIVSELGHGGRFSHSGAWAELRRLRGSSRPEANAPWKRGGARSYSGGCECADECETRPAYRRSRSAPRTDRAGAPESALKLRRGCRELREGVVTARPKRALVE